MYSVAYRVGEFKYVLGSQGSCHGKQIWEKIRGNCSNFSSVQKKSRRIFARIVRLFGSANLNMLYNISRKLMVLPWQPNLDKNKPKLHKF